MAADVRRWRGYCRRTSLWAALTLAMSGDTVSTSTCWPLASMATRRPVDKGDIWPAHASAWACQACAPARGYRTPGALPPPPCPSSHPGGPRHPHPPPLSVPVALPVPPRPCAPSLVALQGFHPGNQAVPLLGDVRQYNSAARLSSLPRDKRALT